MARRVLIVDDHELTVELLTFRIQAMGFEVLTARDGQEALALVARESPDLILLDVMLPGLSGLDVVRELHADPDSRRIPVILLTALGQLPDRHDPAVAGVAACLRKPFNRQELQAAVLAALTNGG